MISVEHVSLTIGTAQILRDISVQFEKGHIHGIVRRNSSGKAMLMKCVCGFICPTAGGSSRQETRRAGMWTFRYSGLKNLKLLAAINRWTSRERLSAPVIK